jgi:nucleotide-binding universal stress UspA family protein
MTELWLEKSMFKKLLVPLDRSALAEEALGPAGAIARASHAAVDVVLVHQPLPFAGWNDTPWNADQATDEDAYLESTVAELISGASIPATHAILRGDPVEAICLRAQDVAADLIVMTSHGRTGFSRAWVGSVADGVVRRSAAPVLMLPPATQKSTRIALHGLFKRVLVPLDGSTLAAEALAPASALAKCSDAHVDLLRVVQPVPLPLSDAGVPFSYASWIPDDAATRQVADHARLQLSNVALRLSEETGLEVNAHVVVAATVAKAILDFAAGNAVDVIAMSTRGRGASRLVIGSVADKLLRGSGLPIMLRHPG